MKNSAWARIRRVFSSKTARQREKLSSYRAGNVHVVRGSKHALPFHDLLRGTGIGFRASDITLRLHKKSGEYVGRMEAKHDDKSLRMHGFVHALHIKLYHDAGLKVVRHSPLFKFEHELLQLFENRRLYLDLKNDQQVTFKDVRKFVEEKRLPDSFFNKFQWSHHGAHAYYVILNLFMTALVQRYPTRKILMEKIHEFYSNPVFQEMVRDLNGRKKFFTMSQFMEVVSFFERKK